MKRNQIVALAKLVYVLAIYAVLASLVLNFVGIMTGRCWLGYPWLLLSWWFGSFVG